MVKKRKETKEAKIKCVPLSAGDRMFCHITKNWRGGPPVSGETAAGNAGTKKGPEIRAESDKNIYGKGRKIKDGEPESVNIGHPDFHGGRNHGIKMSDVQ